MNKIVFLIALFINGGILFSQNLALQKPVSVGSFESGSLLGSNAVDGDMNTRWSSEWSDPQWIYVDLEQPYAIDRVVIYWEGSFAIQYQVQVSTNAIQWTSVATITNGNGGTDTINFTSQNARYIRMYGTQRNSISGFQYGYSIYELEVYGEVPSDDASLLSIDLDGDPFEAFSSMEYNYNYLLGPGGNTVPVATVTTSNPYATTVINNAQNLSESTTIIVTSEDGSVTQTYTISFQLSQYALVWADEFENDGSIYLEGQTNPVDSQKWFHQTFPPNDGGWFNAEQQHYTDELANSYVSDGTLKIVAIKENYQNPATGSVKPYTAARLNSKYAFRYGRMEVRAKLPNEQGTWPAFWTLGKNISEQGAYWQTQGYGDTAWPACGEIDIMEQSTDKSSTSGAFHFPNAQGSHTFTTNHTSVEDTDGTWHVYAMEWTEDTIDLMVDDVVFHSLNNAENPYFDNEHFILLNTAMGGSLGGGIPEDFTSAVMEIDYVRVFQLDALSVNTIADKPVTTVTIYPNPAVNQLYVKATDVIQQLSIFDLQGRILIRQAVAQNQTTLQLNLPKGIYIVKTEGDNFQSIERLIVK